KMFFLPASYAMPDGLLPRFGDDPGTSARSYGPTMEAAYNAYLDPVLLRLLPQTNQWSSVFYGRNPEQAAGDLPEKSELFRDSGHAILRAGGEKKLTSVFKFSRYGGFHDHFDKLSFVFYGCGAELGVDPGRAKSQAYNLPIHTDWYKATLGHNAVLVNQKPQAAGDGELSLFAEVNGFALTEARLTAGFQAVSQRRLLFQSPEYLLVLDRLEALDDAPRTFDWVYHGTGESFDIQGLSTGAGWKDYPGMEYVQDIRTGESSAGVRGTFTSTKAVTHLLMDAQSPTQILAGNGPLSSVNERVPLIIARRTGRSQIFLAALEPTPNGASPDLTALAWKKSGDDLVLEVTRKNG
ncbi:MAG: heparinase II/III family protein, partial [Spirochaetia bacterium]|nr:heparinase II/III family protein [Spirochaetia bacterium]